MKGFMLFGLVLMMTACSKADAPHQSTSKTNHLSPSMSIITPDWGVASTLVGIGNPPVATGDLTTLPDWSVSPAMPEGVMDLGSRFTPNPELMAQLSADLFIYTGFYGHLNTVAMPAWEYQGVDRKGREPVWADYVQAVLALGDKIGKKEQTVNYVNQVAKHLEQQGEIFQQRYPHIKRLAVMQIPNATQFYHYTTSTPFGVAMEKMGLASMAFGDAGEWGTYIGQLNELTKLDADTCLVIVAPFSPMLKAELAKNPLWQRLGYDDGSRCAMVMQPAWAYGDLASMTGFADGLVNATAYTDFGHLGGNK